MKKRPAASAGKKPSLFSSAFHKLSKKVKIILLVLTAVLLAVLIPTGVNYLHNPQAEVVTVNTLQNILNVSDLSTFEAVYNGIADVHNAEKPEKIDYYVSYNARVQAGIDFEQVKTEIDTENKRIVVTLPPVKITDTTVDITTMDYIFENKKAETASVSQEAYKACIDDVARESREQDAIYTLARQNAENIVEALIKPFISQWDASYTLDIRGEGEA